ncbi:HD domain-containing phosphohydrolase [Seleniivibrio woodruffii]|uniref:HD domain-containing phosphohydrolase n=1 Tax=Seleniivibrio woodruffii TaxID=1078050 RepID=UPI0026E9D242|nr:HD domain-containing phosphohydrolase [Seleniivibrio woodruffii]
MDSHDNFNLLKKHLRPQQAKSILCSFAQATGNALGFRIGSGGNVFCQYPENPENEFSAARPLGISGERMGGLFVYSGRDNEGLCCNIADALACSLNSMIECEHARRAVSAETLSAYRELALLQRTADRLNRELKPSGIGSILLDETGLSYEGGKVGVVLEFDKNTKTYRLLANRGEDSDRIFSSFVDSGTCMIFANMDRVQIINDFGLFISSGGKNYYYKSVMIVPLTDGTSYMGYMLTAAPEGDFYSSSDKKRMETISSTAATALHNAIMFDEQKVLFDSFLNAIATAIDAKSPYTAGHCKRVPWIAHELLSAANQMQEGVFSDFTVTEDEINELKVAALLHDCGKISTPEWIMDKSLKLEGIINGIELIRLKMELYKLNLTLGAYKERNGELHDDGKLSAQIEKAGQHMKTLESLNKGGENLDSSVIEWLKDLGKIQIEMSDGRFLPLLNDDEVEKLSIARGTLTAAERQVIEDHVVKTVMMLSEIKFPENMCNVINIAGLHHEKLNGTGYPYRMKGEDIPIRARIIAIADIFEALTAEDRPYKGPGTLSRAIEIMGYMVRDGHIDENLYHLLLESGIHVKYARQFLPPAAMDI